MGEQPRVLALMAHPDDIEFVCAGTLIALRDAGCHVTMINMARGDCGSAEQPASVIAEIRQEEAERSAHLIAADHFCAGYDDLTIFRNDRSARRVTEFVRRARPDIVITHPPADYMSDHDETSRLVRDACFYAPMPNYATHEIDAAPVIAAPPVLFYGDPLEGVGDDGRPAPADILVDISDLFERKALMLCCHESQRNWLRSQHGVDEYVEMLRQWNARRGTQAGVTYAEAFRLHRGHGFPHEDRISAILGARVHPK